MPTPDHNVRPVCWTIAGSDSGGGAGIQADLVTMNALGAHGCSVITALTAQNTLGISLAENVGEKMVRAQLEALSDDLAPSAVKIGMLGSAAATRLVARALKDLGTYVVCDPLLLSTSGHPLLDADARELLVSELFSRVSLLTPNIPEAEALSGMSIESPEDVEVAAQRLLSFGMRSVLIKGGHARGAAWSGEVSQDFWTDGSAKWWFTSPRRKTPHTHGAGCTLSAAIAACRAQGYRETDAVVIARSYLNQGLRLGGGIGHGRGPMDHGCWPSAAEDLPRATASAAEGLKRLQFPELAPGERIGLYPIVDRAEWVRRLLEMGVRTIQIRVKDLSASDCEEEIRKSIELARPSGARLYVNDEWQLAIKHGAYGVHLGQDDMKDANLKAVADAGIRLGISTTNWFEMARASAVRATYAAIGAVFPTASKEIRHRPMGVEGFAKMRRMLDVPVVAIGGISLEAGSPIFKAGANGIAVISDVVNAANPDKRVAEWLSLADRDCVSHH